MYPENFKVSIRKLSENVVTVSCAFKMLSRFDIGNRMSLIKCNDEVIVFSTIPYGDYFNEALEVLGAKKVAYIVVVNLQHNLAVKDYAQRFPDAKIITGEGLKPSSSWKADYLLEKPLGNRLLTSEILKEELLLEWPEGVEMIYLLWSKNNEVVLYEKQSKTVFYGDVIVDIGGFGEEGLEQYSPATGYPEKHNPLTGWSYPLRATHIRSYVGQFVFLALSGANTEEGRKGVKLIADSWDIKTIVPCHGNVMTENAHSDYKTAFPKVFL